MCDSRIEVSVPKGWDYKIVEYRCGSTGVYGQMILCEKCESQREHRESLAEADNAWLRSAGWGEI